MMSESVAHDLSQAANSYPLTIALFGQLRIFVNGKLADSFRLNKSRALLAYLLVENTKSLLRTDLAELFWPGYTADSARANLRQALGDLRTLLEPFDLLQITRTHITLQTPSPHLWCDVLQFQTLVSRWQAHPHRSLADCPSCQADLQQAVALTTGGFLDQLPDIGSPPFAAWRQRQRRHFADQVAAVQTALAAAPQHAGNLRPALTTLIGRTTELAELAQKVQHPTYRCLTLTGPGGVGKSRLARALGVQMQPAFPDGVWLVDLAALSQSSALPTNPAAADLETPGPAWLHDRIATAIANALGLTFHEHGRPSEQVATYLHDKSALLILDNFEQLEAGVDWLLTLLESAPRLRLVITSRHRLPLHAQLVYTIEGLPVPPLVDAPEQPAVPFFTAYASIQLFLERATNAQMPLPFDSATLAIISQICGLVAGLPLAIELAVALLARQSPADLLHAIRDNYRALSGGWRDLSPRQRSAEAVLRSAWALLTPDEATLLARCAVFHGGFTGAAVPTISALTMDTLQALVQKSLVHPVSAERFTLHELVRQFAAEQLTQTATEATVQARHAAYYINFAQAQEVALWQDFAAQEALHHELDNLRAAWHWSATQGDLALLAAGAASFFAFYLLAGLYHEALQHLESAFTRVRPLHTAMPADPTVRRLLARLACYAAEFYRRTGAIAASTGLAEEALALGQGLADPAIQASAYHLLARLAQVDNNLRAMQSWAEAGCTQARLAQRFDLLSECLNDLAITFTLQQQPSAAIPYFEEALRMLTDAPNHYLEVRILANLGWIYLLSCEYELARRYLQRVSRLHQMLRDQENRFLTHLMSGDLWTVIGLYTTAQEEYRQAQALLQLTANPYWVSWLQISAGHLHHLCGDSATARTTLTLGRQTAQQSGNHLFERLALTELGHVLIDQGEWEAAQACFQQSLALHAVAPWLAGTADIHAGLATCCLAQGQKDTALAQVDTALHLLAQHGISVAGHLFSVYWRCFQALQTLADGRAVDVLRTAYARLQACAAQFEEPALRRAFLNNVAVNRHLVLAAQAAGLPAL